MDPRTFFEGRMGRSFAIGLLAVIVSLPLGCDTDLAHQPKFKPYERSDFFPDQRSARPSVPGTVAQGHLELDDYLFKGKVHGKPVDAFPFPITAEVLKRGEEQFNIYCSACHDRLGTGNGMVVRRGFPKPPSYHSDQLRKAKIGHFFDVITNGFGTMPSYKSRVPVRDRWSIVAYIRALQLSQHARLEDVPQAKRKELLGSKR